MEKSHQKRSELRRRPSGRPPKLAYEQMDILRTIVSENRSATVDELCRALADRTGAQVTRMTLYRYLAQAGIRRQPQANRPQVETSPPGAGRAVPVRYGYHPAHRDPGDLTRYPGGLTDAEWALVADLFESHGPGKPPKYPRRQIVDACCYVLRSGCPWRMLPKDLPPWQDVYHYCVESSPTAAHGSNGRSKEGLPIRADARRGAWHSGQRGNHRLSSRAIARRIV